MEDIRLLVTHFIEKYGNSRKIELAPQAWEALYTHSWPGNVRELENVIERAVVLNSGGSIDLKDLPAEFTKSKGDLDVDRFIPPDAPLQSTLEEIEEKLIRRALKHSDNVQSHAAEQLGITKSLIQHKMKKYNISV
jgi:two-component system, NtrC family, response regulator